MEIMADRAAAMAQETRETTWPAWWWLARRQGQIIIRHGAGVGCGQMPKLQQVWPLGKGLPQQAQAELDRDEERDETLWYLDSGATNHMSGTRTAFFDLGT